MTELENMVNGLSYTSWKPKAREYIPFYGPKKYRERMTPLLDEGRVDPSFVNITERLLKDLQVPIAGIATVSPVLIGAFIYLGLN